MSETHKFVDTEIARLADTDGLAYSAAAMRLMVMGAMVMSSSLPSVLRGALAQACSHWFGGLGVSDQSLNHLASGCWSYLQEKHGNSTTVADREDMAIRTLLCVLSDELPDADELDMTVDYFVSMIDSFGGVREVLRGVN